MMIPPCVLTISTRKSSMDSGIQSQGRPTLASQKNSDTGNGSLRNIGNLINKAVRD